MTDRAPHAPRRRPVLRAILLGAALALLAFALGLALPLDHARPAVLAAVQVQAPPTAAPLPRVRPGSRAGAGTFSIVLHGARRPSAPPFFTDGAIIVAVDGTLLWPTGIVRYPHPVAGTTDIVVAQHDTRSLWVVAHTTRPGVPLAVTTQPDALVLTFGTPSAGAAPPHPPQAPAPSRTVFSVRWDGVPVRDAAAVLSRIAGVSVAVDPRIAGTVTLRLDDAGLDTVLGELAAAAHGRVARSGAGYIIEP